MPAFIDRTGQRYMRLLVEGYVPGKRRRAIVLCDCGVRKTVDMNAVVDGRISSCGCLAKEALIGRSRTHGQYLSGAHRSWRAMKQRCENPKDSRFPQYGGRGIRVCGRWKDDFETFLSDMGPRPKGKTLDRINNDGNYEPGNVRWATGKEQARGFVRLPDAAIPIVLARLAAGEQGKKIASDYGVSPATISRISVGRRR